MKKRIISIALVVVMIVAMIPATLLTALAAKYTGYYNGYDVYFSETDLALDGKMDAAYENSEKIISTKVTTHNGAAQGTSFEAYVASTSAGFYLFANVKDSTIDVDAEKAAGVSTGDMVQFYMQVANTTTTGEGDSAVTTTQYSKNYFYCDYAHTEGDNTNVKSASSNVTSDGYSIEIFVPWTVWTGITNGLTLETATVYFGVEVHNYKPGDDTRREAAYDTPSTGSFYGDSYTPGGSGYKATSTTAPAKFMVKANSPKVVKDLKYTSFITDEEITLDGKRDDIYLASEKITSKKISKGEFGTTAGFETYVVAREDGSIYIFASIYDNKLDKAELVNKAPEAATAVENGTTNKPLRIQDGDKFQIYLQLGNNRWQRWGYIDFDYVDGGRHVITGANLGYTVDEVKQEVIIREDGTGWDIEIFLPNSLSVDSRFNPSKGVNNPGVKDFNLKVNFQALNETCFEWNPATGQVYEYDKDNRPRTTKDRIGLAYDIAEASVAYNGPSHEKAYFVPVDFSVNPIPHPGTGVITYGNSVNVDGIKDGIYGDDSTAFVIDREFTKNCSTHANKASAKAWVAITDSKLTLYAEVYDETVTAGTTTANDNIGFYVYFPTSGLASYHAYGYARSGHWASSSDWTKDLFFATNGTLYGENNYASSGRTAATASIGTNKYTVEMAIDLPAAEKYALAQGEMVEVKVGIAHTDCCGADGKTTCYTAKNAYNCGAWTNKGCIPYAYPRFTVSKESTPANVNVSPEITTANVELGESITVNYYANLPVYIENAYMKFTMNDKVTFVKGVPTKATEYEFAFEGLAPQCMGDNIKAELYVDGVKVDSVDEYSVKKNVTNVKNTDNEDLVDALLLYGAAAQQYTNYKTDALVADLSNLDLSNIWEIKNDKDVGTPADKAKFVAAGVRFANVNKLYVKVDNIENVTSLTVKVGDGEPVALELNSNGVAYTDAIKATEFGNVYTFELIDTNEMSQTLKYSVNSYVYAKTMTENDYDSNIAVLSIALYNYGVAAEEYIAN